MYKSWVTVAVAALLVACGGGGGGGSGDRQVTPTSGGAGEAEVPAIANVVPGNSVQTELSAVITSLGLTGYGAPSAPVGLEVGSGAGSYWLDIRSAALGGSMYFSDMALPAARVNLYRADRTLQGFNTTQYSGSVGLSNNTAYAASMQVLTAAGIGTVGFGHWKYQGDQQVGYWSGTRLARGAFLIGDAAASTSSQQVPSGSFAGFSQGLADAHYIDTLDQVTANASAYYDAAAKTVTVRLSNFTYWNSYFGYNGQLSVQWGAPRSSHYLPSSLTCVAPVAAASGAFTGTCTGPLSGQFKGRFFGPQGQIIAGTFTLEGWVLSTGGNSLVGGFAVQRPAAGATVVPQGARWTATPASIEADGYVGTSTKLQIRASAPTVPGQAVNVAVFDSAGYVNPNAYPTLTGQQLDIEVYAKPALQLGTRSGELQLRLCLDDPLVCRQPVAGSPWKIPYRINDRAFPGPSPVFSPTLAGITYEGLGLFLSTTVTMDETSVFGNNYNDQYAFRITDSGIFNAAVTEGKWRASEPTPWSQGRLSFDLKTGLEAGVYDGTIQLSVCGYSYAAQTTCLPTAQPTAQIPYHVEIRSWTDLRPLQLVPQTQAMTNRRGNQTERMSFPVAVAAADISTRWKIPFLGHDSQDGVGQGVVYGYTYTGNDQQKLEVFRESDGALLWSRTFSNPFASGSLYGNFGVTASNGRLYVRLGGGWGSYDMMLKVFDASTGTQLFEKSCSNCTMYLEQGFGHGWGAQFYSPGTHLIEYWLYDERTDNMTVFNAQSSWSSEVTPADAQPFKDAFFAGEDRPVFSPPRDTRHAETANLNITATDQQVTITDKATGAVVWTMPYPGSIVGISNSGVLYLQVKLGPMVQDWPLVAVNLLR